jgi:hypothetical protein
MAEGDLQPVEGFFSRWFDRLVRHGMGAAALATAIISIGWALVLSTPLFPVRYADQIGDTGLLLLQGGCGLLLACGVIHAVQAARKPTAVTTTTRPALPNKH